MSKQQNSGLLLSRRTTKNQGLIKVFLYLCGSLTVMTGRGLDDSSSLSNPAFLYLEMINGNNKQSLFNLIPAELCYISPS